MALPTVSTSMRVMGHERPGVERRALSHPGRSGQVCAVRWAAGNALGASRRAFALLSMRLAVQSAVREVGHPPGSAERRTSLLAPSRIASSASISSSDSVAISRASRLASSVACGSVSAVSILHLRIGQIGEAGQLVGLVPDDVESTAARPGSASRSACRARRAPAPTDRRSKRRDAPPCPSGAARARGAAAGPVRRTASSLDPAPRRRRSRT